MPFLIVVNFFVSQTLSLNIGDTYYVTEFHDITTGLLLILMLTGLIYILFRRMSKNRSLIILHTNLLWLGLASLLLLIVVSEVYDLQDTFEFKPDSSIIFPEHFNLGLIASLFLIALSQLFFIANFFLSLIQVISRSTSKE